MIDEIYLIFKRNLPFITVEEHVVMDLLSDSNNMIFENRDTKGTLIGVSVLNKNTIYLLCVDSLYRHQGIGTDLLVLSEKYIKEQGYGSIQVGLGDDYIMPGIPTSIKPYTEELQYEKIDLSVTDEVCSFFRNRGYVHSWKDSNCFDMKSDLVTFRFPQFDVGDTISDIHYRWATDEDIPNIVACTDDAEPDFSQYYKDENLYKGSQQRVLIAQDHDGCVCGTLIVNAKTNAKAGIGMIGCTAVSHPYRGQHIGTNIAILGTKYLQSTGMKQGFLGFTYSGLNRMYGYAGYKICVYYSMASKLL